MSRRRCPLHRKCVCVVGIVVCLVLTSCAGRRASADAQNAPMRDTARAKRLTLRAAEVFEEHPERLTSAEEIARAAVNADQFYGPAHNNLGVIYFKQLKLYEAASAFESARKLMPNNPDPRVNLGLVLERAGRLDEAMVEYAAALEVAPDHLEATQVLVRLQIRTGKTDARTRSRLEAVALQGDAAWREWAILHLKLLPESR